MPTYDSHTAADLAALLNLPRVVLHDRTTSTMDDAHALAANGAPAGTLVVANEQTAGRGRSGARWLGTPGSSVLCTVIERPHPDALGLLSLRVGLGASQTLDRLANASVRVKWPNDLYIGDGKLAGVLVEARWREQRLEWVAIAMGLNLVAPPDVPGAAGLPGDVTRADVLASIVPAMRSAATATGPLSASEMAEWSRRDWLAGRRLSAPLTGVVCGVQPTGELAVDTATGREYVRSGSVQLA